MSFLSYFKPLNIITLKSPINGEIKVVESFGKKAVYVDGAPQSGAEITPMWEKIIKNLKLKIKNCLILGIGGGDIIKSIKKYYPEAAITGVEIDPTMIDIARKYFGLGEIPKCKIVISDAIDYVRKENPKKFGLIVVDFFVGKLNPPNSRGRNFLLGLKRMKTAEGIIIYNSHYQEDNPDEFRKFKDTCKQVFPYVSEVFAYRNNRVVKLKSDV